MPLFLPCLRSTVAPTSSWSGKFFCLQLGTRMDVVSVDRLKPVFSSDSISPALPPPRGRPTQRILDLVLVPPVLLSPPSAADPAPIRPKKRVTFRLLPAVPVWQNPLRAVCSRRICSTVAPPILLGGVLWQNDVCHSIPEFQDYKLNPDVQY